MTRTEIEEKVKTFLIEDLEVDEENLSPDAKLPDDLGIDSLDFVDIVVIDEEKITHDANLRKDLGIDSLDFVDIVVVVERKFGFKIKQEEMVGVDTFSKFCDYIETKVN